MQTCVTWQSKPKPKPKPKSKPKPQTPAINIRYALDVGNFFQKLYFHSKILTDYYFAKLQRKISIPVFLRF